MCYNIVIIYGFQTHFTLCLCGAFFNIIDVCYILHQIFICVLHLVFRGKSKENETSETEDILKSIILIATNISLAFITQYLTTMHRNDIKQVALSLDFNDTFLG